jgi:hypothetical protein
MKFITKIKDYITEIDIQKMYRFMIIILFIVIIVVGFLFYNYMSRTHEWEKKIKRINQLRTQTRELLEKNEIVKQQKAYVEEILAEDKNFTLKNYFISLVQELQLGSTLTKDPTVSKPEVIDTDYAEIKLDASFSNINTKQLSQLLENLENNKRISLKELSITRALKTPSIDVTLVIATLQPQSTMS